VFTTETVRRGEAAVLPQVVRSSLTIVPINGTIETVRDDLRPALFGSVLRDRILVRLALSENGLHVRELARQIDASPTAVHRAVIALERTGVVVSREVGNARVVVLNRRWYGGVELRALLTRLVDAYPEVRERAVTRRERPRRIGKPL
jgi:DNA-binding transcriptional ArsR family regulator